MIEGAENNDFIDVRIRRPGAGGFTTAGTNLTLRLPVVRRDAGSAVVKTAGGRVRLDTSGGPYDLARIEFALFSNFVAGFAAAAAYSGDALVEVRRVRQIGRGLARWLVEARWQGRPHGSIVIESAAKLAVVRDGRSFLPRWVILARAREIDGGGRGAGEHLVVPCGEWPGLDAAVSDWKRQLDIDKLEVSVVIQRPWLEKKDRDAARRAGGEITEGG